MNVAMATGRSLRDALADWQARLRETHPTTVLRWLRAGVLAMVVTTALLYLLVVTAAGQQIADVKRTDHAIEDITKASWEAELADEALKNAFSSRQVALIGTGTAFANATARVNTLVTSAAQDNAAGTEGLNQIQFVQGQLTTCVQLADAAVRAYTSSRRDGMDEGDDARSRAASMAAARTALTTKQETDPDTGKSIPGTGGLKEGLGDLKALEQRERDKQRNSRWLERGFVWSLLMGPVVVMLVLVLVTADVVARHFRRYVSPQLPGSLLATAGVAITTGILSGHDERHLHERPWAGHPVTMGVALSLLAAAAVLAYLAYRSRLAEYRFRQP